MYRRKIKLQSINNSLNNFLYTNFSCISFYIYLVFFCSIDGANPKGKQALGNGQFISSRISAHSCPRGRLYFSDKRCLPISWARLFAQRRKREFLFITSERYNFCYILLSFSRYLINLFCLFQQVTSPSSITSSIDDESSIDDFLAKMDSSIASMKKEVKRAQGNSE